MINETKDNEKKGDRPHNRANGSFPHPKVICSICQSEFDCELEGGIEGYIGIIPVKFCPTCYSGITDMVGQVQDEYLLDFLIDSVNQGCREEIRDENYQSIDYQLCTMAISTYEQALEYLVKIGKAEWIKGKEGFLAKWKTNENKEMGVE